MRTHKFCSFLRSCVVPTFFLYDGRLHRFWRFEDFERKKEKCMFPHYITCGPPQRRREEVLREILIIIFRGGELELELELFLKVATMNEWEDTPFFDKFCSFWSSCGLRETSRVVDYTQILKIWRFWEKKGKMYVSPLHHRPTTTEREREEIFF